MKAALLRRLKNLIVSRSENTSSPLHVRSFHDGRLIGHVLLPSFQGPRDRPGLETPEDGWWRVDRGSGDQFRSLISVQT